ncbi:hypothetical protein D910_12018 [Dendroctonus ponderosae]|uniref:Uncharacterized protein n=1 Tax=Dendroctonus ponderosae TaxID=77166 RepID=U4UKZ5_DENPD|nr:hypothetical protein D910_12018 [Dendroctonus ponderosae]
MSTLGHIPNVNATIKHSQNYTDYKSLIYLMYNPDFIIDVDSYWQHQTNEHFSNLSGTVNTLTPFKGLEKGILVTKIFYTEDKHLRGVAEIDLDHKKMLVAMEGKFRKLMDSMFIANISTTEEKYQCQFKISKKDRHFVALITYPDGNLGTEVLFALNDLIDFDVKIFLATPIEFLQKVLIVAKLHTGKADFRIGWNSLLLGFSGIAHYVNIIDFQYTYKIYTPIKDFEENGLVAKLIFKKGLDFETSLQLSRYKVNVS